MRRRTFLGLASPFALGLALTSCTAVGGAPIPPPTAAITQSEATQGAQYHQQLLAEFGGAMSGNRAVYVEEVGRNVASQSGLAGARDSFTVSLLNSSVNNAFATTGGYIYTTRQLLALMDNEAELAAVLAHETGHVAARHLQRRQRAAQENTLFGAGVAILSSILLGDSQIGNLITRGALQAPQFLTLSYSREQEEEADRLGIDYLSRAGYDPRAMATLLQRLTLQTDLDAQLQGRQSARPPEWASTHPDPARRVQIALSYAAGKPGNVINREAFLSRIDGMVYGDDPEQGIIDGRQFIHPVMRFAFTAPDGFYLINSPQQVTISGQSGQAELRVARTNNALTQFVSERFAELAGQGQAIRPNIQRTTVNGIPAAVGTARASTNSGQVDVVVFAYEFGGGQTFYYQAITPAGRSSAFSPMFQSFRRVSASEAGQVVPRVVDVVTVRSGDTVAALSRRMAFETAQEARFRVLNGLGPNDVLRAGQQVKLVVRAR